MDELLPRLREVALALGLTWTLLEALRPRPTGRVLAALCAGALLLLLGWRGVAVEFFPLTNKYESFLCFSASAAGVAAWRWERLGRAGRVTLGLVCSAFLGATLGFDEALRFPPPLMITVWYPLHIPLCFVAYALWLGAAGSAVDRLLGLSEVSFRARFDADVRLGLLLFSAGMIFGSVWGVVSWGVYFLWDAKVLWSLATWVFFTSLAHLRYWPRLGWRVRPALALVGAVMVLVTYVGTSFMTGSIHSF